MNGLPITNYQIRQASTWVKAFVTVTAAIFLFGNIITAIVKSPIEVDPQSYTIRDGFPVFTSQEAYIALLKSYPYDIGTGLRFHTMRNGESFWNIAKRYNISLDTLIAANPFLKTLIGQEGLTIVIPKDNGTLVAVDDAGDVSRMANLLGVNEAFGDYRHSIFELISLDDIRFAFFRNARPVIVSRWLQRLYNVRRFFQKPVRGHLTSLYGNRFDPLFRVIAFHNGVDIQARMGTPIYPAAEGIVQEAKWHDGYGLTITVQHRDGYISMYGHCSSIRVKRGEWVTKKTIIGAVGSTGRSTGPHLHFSMSRHGKTINPLLFIW